MNIFILDMNPQIAATYLVDTHAKNGKMIVESAQMLANCYSLDRLSDLDCPKTQKGVNRTYGYFNHPCSKWVRESKWNFNWLVQHALAIGEERKFRTNKGHFTLDFIKWCENNNPNLIDIGYTFPALAMPDEYKNDDPVVAYRSYYIGAKRHLAKWTKRNVPDWWRNDN